MSYGRYQTHIRFSFEGIRISCAQGCYFHDGTTFLRTHMPHGLKNIGAGGGRDCMHSYRDPGEPRGKLAFVTSLKY